MVRFNEEIGLPTIALRVIHDEPELSFEEELLELEEGKTRIKSGVKVIVVGNGKGGCGKTTVASGLIAFYARMGYTAIGIDLDPQCNLTLRIGLSDGEYSEHRIDQFFNGINQPNVDAIFMNLPVMIKQKYFFRAKRSDREPGLMGILPGSSLANISADAALRSKAVNRLAKKDKRDLYEVFADCINRLKPYVDVIVIDLSPAYEGNTLSQLAIRVADEVIIPVDGLEAAIGLTNYMSWIDNECHEKKGDAARPNVTFAMVKYQDDYTPLVKLQNPDENQNPLEKNIVYRILKHNLGNFVCDNGIKESKSVRNTLYTGIGQNSIYDELCFEIMEKMSTPRPNIFEHWPMISEKLQRTLANVETQNSRPEITVMSPVFLASPKRSQMLKKLEVLEDVGITSRSK